jgi:hypothetical protein
MTARAQQSLPVIGYLNPGSLAEVEATGLLPAFRQGLAQVGYLERQNVMIEYRFAENDNARLPSLAETWRNVASPLLRQLAVMLQPSQQRRPRQPFPSFFGPGQILSGLDLSPVSTAPVAT